MELVVTQSSPTSESSGTSIIMLFSKKRAAPGKGGEKGEREGRNGVRIGGKEGGRERVEGEKERMWKKKWDWR